MLGKELWASVQIKSPVTWFGHPQAGFYVATDYIGENSIVYSFGVGENISFDEKLIELYNSTVYAFDPTPKTKVFLEKKGIPPNFIFLDYGLYDFNGMVTFYLPENPMYVSGATFNRWKYNESMNHPIEVPVKRFSTIIKELRHSRIDILKMDIEGSEYTVLDDILNSGIEIKQILIEFHHRFKEIGLQKSRDAIKKLNEKGYKIAAISDSREEYTFIKPRR